MADPVYRTRFASGFLEGMWAGRGYNWQSNTPTWETDAGFTSGRALQVLGLANGTQVPGTTQGGATANPDGAQRIEVEPDIRALPTSVKGTGADPALIYPGATGYFGLAFTLAADFPTNPRSGSGGLAWQVISQFKNEGGGTPPFELSIGDNMLYLDGNNSGWRIDVAPVVAGGTYRVVMGVTFTEAAATSVVSVWVNGVLKVSSQTPVGKGGNPSGFLYPGLAGYWKMGLYRRANMPTVAEARIRFAAVAADASRQNVQDYLDAAVVGAVAPTTPPAGTDAYQRAVLAELQSWKAWLTANGNARGYVGEFGGVTLMAYYDQPAEQAKWDALAEVYSAALEYHGMWGTPWAAGREWGLGYPLGLIVGANVGDPLSATHQGWNVYQGHPSRGTERHGVNLAGWEQGVTISGGGTVRQSGGRPHTAADFQVLKTWGVDTVRLCIAWERLQPTRGGALDTAALALLDEQLTAAAAQGIAVILDLHNYGRFTNADGSVSVLGGTLTNAQFSDFWTRMSTWVRATTTRNTTVIAYDLMNEPNALTGGAVTWENASQAVVTALRQAGDTRTLVIEGHSFASMTQWAIEHPDGWITDPSNNFLYSAHHYWDTQSALGSRSGTYQQSPTGPILTYGIELAARVEDEGGGGTVDPNPGTGPQPPAFAALTEDFTALARAAGQKWGNTWDGQNNQAGAVAATGGRLTITSVAGPNYASAQTLDVWRLSNSQVRVEVPKVQAVTTGSTGTVQTALIVNSPTSPAGTRLMISHRADLGTLQFRLDVNYGDGAMVSVPYVAGTHRWWGIRHDGTSVVFETSPDGLTWTPRRTITAPVWTSNTNLRLTLEAWRDNGAGDTAQFDNVNLAGATLPAVATLAASGTVFPSGDQVLPVAAMLGAGARVVLSDPDAIAYPTAALAARGQLAADAVRTTAAENTPLAARASVAPSYTTRTSSSAALAARASMAPVSPGQYAGAALAATAGMSSTALASRPVDAVLAGRAQLYAGEQVLPALGAGMGVRAQLGVRTTDYRALTLRDGPTYSAGGVVSGTGGLTGEFGPTGQPVYRRDRVPGTAPGWGVYIAADLPGAVIPAGTPFTVTWWARGLGFQAAQICTDPAGDTVAGQPGAELTGTWQRYTLTAPAAVDWTPGSQRFRSALGQADTSWIEWSDVRIQVGDLGITQTHATNPAALAARGSVTAGVTLGASSASALAARASVTAAGMQAYGAGSVLAARAAVSPGGYAAKRAAATLAARAVMVGAGDGTVPILASLAARATLDSESWQTAVGRATLGVRAQFFVGVLAGARLAARASVTPAGTLGRASAAAMAARAAVAVSGTRAVPTVATLAARALLTSGPGAIVADWGAHALRARAEVLANRPGTTRPALIYPSRPYTPQVDVPRLRLLVANARSGRVLWELPHDTLQWNSPLNKIGSLTASLPVEDILDSVHEQGARDPGAELYDALTGRMKNVILVAYGNDILWGGPLMSARESGDRPVIDIGAAEFARYFEKRVVFNPAYDPLTWGAGHAVRDVVLTQTNVRYALHSLIEFANSSYATDASGVVNTRRFATLYSPGITGISAFGDEDFAWRSYDLTKTWAAITDLTNRIDGPDVRITPSLLGYGQFVQWALEVGDPFLTGSGPVGPDGPEPWVWDDYEARVSRDSDSVGLATVMFVPGEGQERAKIIATKRDDYLYNLGWPVLEEVDSSQSSEKNKANLQAYADGLVASQTKTTEVWKVTVPLDGTQRAGQFRTGDAARFDLTRHILIPRGSYHRRITDISHDGGPNLVLTCDDEDDLMGVF